MQTRRVSRRLSSAAAIACLATLAFASDTRAQEDTREVRVAIMQHDIRHLEAGDRESGANLELALLSRPIAALDAVGQPRAYISGSLNSDGDTNFASIGLSWRPSLSRRFSGELQIGYAVHDGVLDTVDPLEARNRILLGSRDLFRTAVGLDWAASQDVRIGLQWVHLSHGQILGSGRNQGIDTAGIVITYRFR